MLTPTTDTDYNEASREVHVKLSIYFEDKPLDVSIDNYLISATLLEEAQAESQTILGQVSSNELSFDLYNDTGIFTPTNTNSPYYGKIKKDIKVKAYGRAGVDTSWDELGTFYVKSWSTAASGLVASVTANDKLYDVFDAPVPPYKVTKDVSVQDLLESYFAALGVEATLRGDFGHMLQYAYVGTNNKTFLNDLTNGALAMCYGNRRDGVDIISRLDSHKLRATITDNDQIIDITTSQTIDAGYDGVSVTCNSKQESTNGVILAIKGQVLEPGDTALTNLNIVEGPIVRLGYAETLGVGTTFAKKVTASPYHVNLHMVNEEAVAQVVDINVAGTVLQTISSVEADKGNNLLELDSNYIQTPAQCSEVARYLRKAIKVATPTLNVETRGNFKLLLGDMIHVQSDKFKVDFMGVIIRSRYSYEGGLKCSLTVMDAKLFGEVIQ